MIVVRRSAGSIIKRMQKRRTGMTNADHQPFSPFVFQEVAICNKQNVGSQMQFAQSCVDVSLEQGSTAERIV